jgi:hypothetical protein
MVTGPTYESSFLRCYEIMFLHLFSHGDNSLGRQSPLVSDNIPTSANSFTFLKTRQAVHYSIAYEAHSCNHCCSRKTKKKTITITYCERVFVALIIHRAMPMRRIILPSVVCPAVQYFSTLLQTALFCNKKKIN